MSSLPRKPVTKTEARRMIRDARRYLSIALNAIDWNDAQLLEHYLSDGAAIANQAYTDIFDREVGAGLRGVVETTSP
jgi:ribosomal protein S18